MTVGRDWRSGEVPREARRAGKWINPGIGQFEPATEILEQPQSGPVFYFVRAIDRRNMVELTLD
jgi:hypothetical protein